MIVCTHSHADHSPGAKPLQALCRKAIDGQPLIHGLPSGAHASSNSYFLPDKTLQNKEQIRLMSRRLEVDLTTTIEVIFTPGHAENHVCLVLVEDGLLLSGDHILNGSTTVINPPDGHMGDYLNSLDQLTELCQKYDIKQILPAHGYVLDHAERVIAHLANHFSVEYDVQIALTLGSAENRLTVSIAAGEKIPEGDWVAKAYDDVPHHLWPVAKRSLLAHVEHIRSLNQASH